jgi:hypothetical protein
MKIRPQTHRVEENDGLQLQLEDKKLGRFMYETSKHAL